MVCHLQYEERYKQIYNEQSGSQHQPESTAPKKKEAKLRSLLVQLDIDSDTDTSDDDTARQVSQATSLQNIIFNMAEGEAGAEQKGIFQDNGSGGFMTDLVFNGGKPNAVSGRDVLSHLMDRQVWYLGRESAVSHRLLQQSGLTE